MTVWGVADSAKRAAALRRGAAAVRSGAVLRCKLFCSVVAVLWHHARVMLRDAVQHYVRRIATPCGAAYGASLTDDPHPLS